MLWARVYILWLFRLVPMPSGGCTRSCYLSSWVRSAAVGQPGGLCPLCPPDSTSSQRRRQRREPESRAAPSIPRMLLWVQLNEGSSSSWLCWCSTTLLRKLIAGLKQGSNALQGWSDDPHLEEMSCAYVDCNTQTGMVCPELFFQRWLTSFICKILFRRGISVAA